MKVDPRLGQVIQGLGPCARAIGWTLIEAGAEGLGKLCKKVEAHAEERYHAADADLGAITER